MPVSPPEALPVLELDSEASAALESEVWERRRRALRNRHRTMLAVAVAVVVLAFSLTLEGNDGVAFQNYRLPELCGSRLMFDTECPGCGLTRSILALAEGDWQKSLGFHAVGWVMALAIALQIPYRLYRLHELDTRISEARWPVWFGNSLIALLIINWLVGTIAS